MAEQIEVVPTDAERQQASRLLDDLTFGGHSQDGAASMLAYALACAREEGRQSVIVTPQERGRHSER